MFREHLLAEGKKKKKDLATEPQVLCTVQIFTNVNRKVLQHDARRVISLPLDEKNLNVCFNIFSFVFCRRLSEKIKYFKESSLQHKT